MAEFELKFLDNKRALRKLSKAQRKVDRYCDKHKRKFNKRQHKKLCKLLKKKTRALSKATGMKIYSICD